MAGQRLNRWKYFGVTALTLITLVLGVVTGLTGQSVYAQTAPVNGACPDGTRLIPASGTGVTARPATCVAIANTAPVNGACPDGFRFVPASGTGVTARPAACVAITTAAPRSQADCPAGTTFVGPSGTGAFARPAACTTNAPRSQADCPTGTRYVAASGTGVTARPAVCAAITAAEPKSQADCPAGTTFVAATGTGVFARPAACATNTPKSQADCPDGTTFTEATGAGVFARPAACAGADSALAGEEDPSLKCNVSANPLTWFLCPFIKGMNAVISGLDNAIYDFLTVKEAKIFERDCAKNPKPDCDIAAAYYTAWQTFRGFAIAILIIAGLAMVIGQALGFETLDAYTMKKILPRLIIAIIGISLSWEIMRFFIGFTNDLGNGVRNIIYFPFREFEQELKLDVGNQLLLNLIGGPAILALGLVGLLSFVGTAALAVGIAFLVLILRQLIIIVLILFAPIAIACYILPNTQGVWKIWYESFTKALMMFPIIVAFLAIGKVFAVTSIGGNVSSAPAVSQLVGYAAYILPYFLIPKTFAFAGGALRTIGGMANDRSRGGFDRLKKFRQNKVAQRGHAFKGGSLYQDRGPGKLVNNLGRRVGVGAQGRYGVGKTGQSAMGLASNARRAQTLKDNPNLAELANNDDANAVLGLSGGSKGGARQAVNELKSSWMAPHRQSYQAAQSELATAKTGYAAGTVSQADLDAKQLAYNDEEANYMTQTKSIDARAEGAYAGANAVGFSRQNAAAAMQTMAQNKSRAIEPGGFGIVQNGINRLAGGNDSEKMGYAQGYQYFSREAGRADLGSNWSAADLAAKGASLAGRTGTDQTTAVKDIIAMEGMGRTEVPSMLRGHSSQLKQSSQTLKRMMVSGDVGEREMAATRILELQKNISYGSGDNQKIINELLTSPEVGVNYTDPRAIEQQLADRTNYLNSTKVPLPTGATAHKQVDATSLTRAARTYDRETMDRQNTGIL